MSELIIKHSKLRPPEDVVQELDPVKALVNVRSELSTLEKKHGKTTCEMVKNTDPEDQDLSCEIRHWLLLAIMEQDLIENPYPNICKTPTCPA